MAQADLADTAESVTDCDREPIHVPGAILPHGAMLVLDPDSLEILQAAGDLAGLLGVEGALTGRFAHEIFRPDQIELLHALAVAFSLTKPRHLLDPQLRVRPDRPLDASLHRSDGALVLEFEAADVQDRFAADPLAGVQEMIAGLDAAIPLRELCQIAAERVRKVAAYDRVLVYRFMQDGSGWVIAESREPHLAPFLDLHYPAADIPAQARALYVKTSLRLITQVEYQPAPLVPPDNPRTGRPLDMSYAILRDVSPVHRLYLRNMGIDASMSISIVRGGQLWGLIACHHYSPRRLPRHLRAVCELFGSMFSLQLEARERTEELGERLSSRMVLQNLMLNLATADDYAVGLTRESPNLLDYIHGGRAALDGSPQGGVAVCVKGRLTSLGTTPDEAQIHSLVDWLNRQMPKTEGIYATDRLGEVWAPAAAYADRASGMLVISVSHEASDFIIWFRPELVGTTHWAGEPGKSADDDGRLSPRKSFEVWKETVRGRCLPWAPADLDAAFDLRISLLHVVLRRIDAARRERRLAAERDALLMAELDHRVKNTLANIQALVVRTSRSAESLTGFVAGLDGRIQSMAKAHSLLSESRWEGIAIDRLIGEELVAYGGGTGSIVLDGPSVALTPKSALSLSLTVHELATNAVKYGALSVAGGSIAVSWALRDGIGLELSWTESGGPPVLPPTRRGFGTTLIGRALAMETGGHAVLRYLPAGLVCDAFLPAAALLKTPAEPQPAPLVPSAPAYGLPAAAHRYRILVVEDSFLLVSTIEDVLDELGWQIVGPATRLAAALELASAGGFDAALLDVNLNDELSWPVASLLLARGVPFLVTTGYNAGTVLPDEFAGCLVITKPYSAATLEQGLRKVLGEAMPRGA
jgi:light-regulated signal transduction histidine kinase (bacteriophytochrome)